VSRYKFAFPTSSYLPQPDQSRLIQHNMLLPAIDTVLYARDVLPKAPVSGLPHPASKNSKQHSSTPSHHPRLVSPHSEYKPVPH
jgi:hypothetical protein